jgi:hypothetical protein
MSAAGDDGNAVEEATGVGGSQVPSRVAGGWARKDEIRKEEEEKRKNLQQKLGKRRMVMKKDGKSDKETRKPTVEGAACHDQRGQGRSARGMKFALLRFALALSWLEG